MTPQPDGRTMSVWNIIWWIGTGVLALATIVVWAIGIISPVGKIEETHKTVLWIKNKLNHDS